MSFDYKRILPLTSAQAGALQAQPVGNMAWYLDIRGPIDPVLFEIALRRVVSEVDVLNARIQDDHLLVDPDPTWQLHHVDVPDEQAALDWMRADCGQRTDLERRPVFTTALFRISPDRFLWYLRTHHVVYDGAGLSLLLHRAAELYTALVLRRAVPDSPFAPLELLVAEENCYRESVEYLRDKHFWLQRVTGQPEPVSFTDRTAPAHERPHIKTGTLSAKDLGRLQAAAGQITRSWSVLLTTTAAYLHRWTRSQDVVLGLAFRGRGCGPVDRVPGMTVSVLPMPSALTAETTLAKLHAQTSAEVREMKAHQRFSGHELRAAQRTHGPVFNIRPMLGDLRFGGHPAALHHLLVGSVEDLWISMYDSAGAVTVEIAANPALYTEDECAAHLDRLLHFCRALGAAGPDVAVADVELLTPAEKQAVLHEWNDTTCDLLDASLVELFAAQVEWTPDAVAVVDGTTELSYVDLDVRANRLANRLIERGITPGDRVALALPMSADLVVAVLATVKTGAAYVPLDPSRPQARDTGARIMLTPLDLTDEGLAHDPGIVGTPDQLAFVLYPSGVAVSHRNVTVLAADRCWRGGALERVLTSEATHDLWVPLLAGGTVVIATAEPLARQITENRITGLVLTAARFDSAVREDPACFAGVREVMGDGLSATSVRRVLAACPDVVVCNGYRAAETTGFATRYLARADDATLPVGRPLDNTRTYVLDERSRPVPPGAVGDLFVAGPRVAVGYLNRPERTAQRFLEDPFLPGERMYRTGDRARWRGPHTLEVQKGYT